MQKIVVPLKLDQKLIKQIVLDVRKNKGKQEKGA